MRVEWALVATFVLAATLSGCVDHETSDNENGPDHLGSDDDGPGNGDGLIVHTPQAGLPVASFDVSCEELTCTFEAGSGTEFYEIDDYVWNLGDKTTSTKRIVEKTYDSNGTYEVRLIVSNAIGTDAWAKAVTVVIGDVGDNETPEAGPVARFSHSCDGLVCQFDATDSMAGNTSIVDYDWIWGDNEPGGSGAVVDHTYAQEGSYTVYLAVTDEEGLWDQIERKVRVLEGGCDGPAHPGEQQKDDPNAVLCPGEYAITDEGTGEGWEVPEWDTGDWWRLEFHNYPGPPCSPSADYSRPWYRETVQGSDTANGEDWAVEVHEMEVTTALCMEESMTSEELTRTKPHLNKIGEAGKGYVEHELLFPLADGKKWVYRDSNGDRVEAEVAYLGDFTAHESTWRIKMEHENEQAPQITHYIDEDVGFWVQQEFVFEDEDDIRLLLMEWHDGDIGGPPPGP